MSLTDKVQNNQFIVVDQIALSAAKTKEFVKVLAGLKSGVKELGKKQLVLLQSKDGALVRACRNVPYVNSSMVNSLNIVDVMKADAIVVLKDSLPVIEKTYLKN